MGTTRQDLLNECLRCQSPQGADIRHALAQTGEETLDDKQLSPTGRPLGCCRIRPVGAIDREQGVPAGGGMAAVNNYGPPSRFRS
jgi:hypothetical protein